MNLTKKKTDIGATREVGYQEGNKRMKILYYLSNCSIMCDKLVLTYDWIPEYGWYGDVPFMDVCLAPGNNLFDQKIWSCDDVNSEAQI